MVENDKVLAFEHPNAGCQIPKGSVEKNEDIETAVLRELCEESGISTGRIVRKVGELDWVV